MATPLYTFDYYGKKIETYSTYSIVDGQVSTNFRYYVKSGNLIVVDSAINPVADGVFAYYTGGNSYIAVLNTDGEIVSMGNVNIPASLEGFKNEGITSLASNLESDSSSFVVTYANGATVGYDVISGAEIFRTGESEKTGMGEYLINYVKGMFSDIGQTSYSSSRSSADSLINQLEIGHYSISDLASSGVLGDSEALGQFLETGVVEGNLVEGAAPAEGYGGAEVVSEVPEGHEDEYVYDQQLGAYIKLSDVNYEYDTTVYDRKADSQAEGVQGEAWVIDTSKPYSEQNGTEGDGGTSTANGKNKDMTSDAVPENKDKTSTGQTKDEQSGTQLKSENGKVGSPDGVTNEETAAKSDDANYSMNVGAEEEAGETALADGPGGSENTEETAGDPAEAEAHDKQESIMNNSDKEEYVAVYNPETDSYDIYSVSELMENPEGAESENSKLGGQQTDALAKMLSASEDHTKERGFNIYSVVIGIVLVLFIVAGFTLKRARKEVHYDDDNGYIN